MFSNFRRRLAIAGCAALLAVLAGCKTGPSQYVSPRIIGRVMDGQTHQPIKDAQVRRVTANESYQMEPPKGAQLLERSAGAFTKADGTFDLDSEKDVTLFHKFLWYSVTIAYTHDGYQRFQTVYTIANSTNAPNGEPIVQAGDVLLMPLAK